MRVLNNVLLKDYTTFRIGGCAKVFYIPQNIEELKKIMDEISNEDYYVIGGGSNLLINDQKIFKNVVDVSSFDKSISNLGKGKYYIGASVRLQTLINKINDDGFGGIEYLYSVPGLVGGVIVMNAGRGKQYGLSISDHIIDVHVYINGNIKVLKKEECEFEYRNSIFKNSNYIILGATLKFDLMNIKESERLKKERLKLCKEFQDNSAYNFGSVFMECNGTIMRIIKRILPGYKNGVKFSKKTPNWLLNEGEGTFCQAISLINRVKKIHKIFGKKAIPEVIIWA